MRDRSPAEWLCCRDVREVWIRISLHETEAAALFKGGHFEAEIILLCVRWNLGYPLSLRQLEENHGGAEPQRGPRDDLALRPAVRAFAERPVPLSPIVFR